MSENKEFTWALPDKLVHFETKRKDNPSEIITKNLKDLTGIVYARYIDFTEEGNREKWSHLVNLFYGNEVLRDIVKSDAIIQPMAIESVKYTSPPCYEPDAYLANGISFKLREDPKVLGDFVEYYNEKFAKEAPSVSVESLKPSYEISYDDIMRFDFNVEQLHFATYIRNRSQMEPIWPPKGNAQNGTVECIPFATSFDKTIANQEWLQPFLDKISELVEFVCFESLNVQDDENLVIN